MGYAQSKVQDFKNIRGVNLQYRYEFDDSQLSVLGSFSWMQGDEDRHYYDVGDSVKEYDEVKYYSLLVGPAYRVNEYFSFYVLGGVAYSKADGNTTWVNLGDNYVEHDSFSYKYTSFACGAGVIINPMVNFSVNVGYEGTTADYSDNYTLNGFNIGVGYRF